MKLGIVASQNKGAKQKPTNWLFLYQQTSTPYPNEYDFLVATPLSSSDSYEAHMYLMLNYLPGNRELGEIYVVFDTIGGDYYFFEAE